MHAYMHRTDLCMHARTHPMHAITQLMHVQVHTIITTAIKITATPSSITTHYHGSSPKLITTTHCGYLLWLLTTSNYLNCSSRLTTTLPRLLNPRSPPHLNTTVTCTWLITSPPITMSHYHGYPLPTHYVSLLLPCLINTIHHGYPHYHGITTAHHHRSLPQLTSLVSSLLTRTRLITTSLITTATTLAAQLTLTTTPSLITTARLITTAIKILLSVTKLAS